MLRLTMTQRKARHSWTYYACCLSALFFITGYALANGNTNKASKIIYVRPVPHNDDPYLQQGSNGIKQAASMYQLQASTLESQASRAGRQQQLDNAIKLNYLRQSRRFIAGAPQRRG